MNNRASWHRDGTAFRAAALLLSSLLLTPLQAATDENTGRDYFAKQYYEEAAPLLAQAYQRSHSTHDARLLGASYYHLLAFDKAEPLLSEVVSKAPDDIASRLMLAEILLTLKKFKESDPHISYLRQHAADQSMSWVLDARRHVAKKENLVAIKKYQHAFQLSDDTMVRHALELMMLYIENDDEPSARALAERVIHYAPDAFEVYELKRRMEEMAALARPDRFRDRPYTIQLGYLLEHDDYLLVEPDNILISQEYERENDLRHIVTLKAAGKYTLDNRRELYGEAALYRSNHNRRAEYNQLRQDYMGGMHWALGQYGLRLPYHFSHSDLDGAFYHQSHAITPEAYLRIDNTSSLHGLLKLQFDDFLDAATEAEQRSGLQKSFSILYHHAFHRNRGQGNYMFTLLDNDSDGNNWDYREQLACAYVTYYFTNRLAGRFDLRHGQQGFTKSHDIYGVERDDRHNSASVSLSYWPDKELELIANGMWIERESNVELYDYTRKIAGLGLNWHF